MTTKHINTMYPNIPDNFHTIVRVERIRQGLSQQKLGDAVGMTSVMISMLERGVRNFSYNAAEDIRRALDLEIVLPLPDISKATKIARNRERVKVETDPFFIEVDGELIKVIRYCRLGKVVHGTVV